MEYLNNTPFGYFCQPQMDNFYIIFFEVIIVKTRLKELREDNDLTQEKCSKIAYISKNSYIRYENDERIPPLDVIKFFAKYS